MRSPIRKFLPAVVGLLLAARVSAAPFASNEEVLTRPASEVEDRLPESHPAYYFVYSSRRWDEAGRNDAVMWLYVAQLRYRLHLAANPTLEPGGDPALYSSLSATIAQPINWYAGGDIPNFRRQIARALAWDKEHPNNFTSTRTFSKQWQETRAGLEKFSENMQKNAATLRQQREAAIAKSTQPRVAPDKVPSLSIGRTERPAQLRPLMPANWPALEPQTTTAMIAGEYEGGASSPFLRAFFVTEQGKVHRANSFEIAATGEQQLRIVARRAGKPLHERLIQVEPADRGLVFTETAPDREAGRDLGPVTRRQVLFKNTAGELVILREIFTGTGSPAEMTAGVPKFSFWNRAVRGGAE